MQCGKRIEGGIKIEGQEGEKIGMSGRPIGMPTYRTKPRKVNGALTDG